MTITLRAAPPCPSWSVRLGQLSHACCAGLLLTLGVLLVWRPLPGWLDFWAHAAVGRWTWQTGRVPDHTLFLWTADVPWVYHHWLAQVIFYGLTNVGSPSDLPYVVLGFTALLGLLPFVLVWLVWCRYGRLSAWIAVPLVLALKGLVIRLQTRPELFTGLCLSLLLTFLLAWSRVPGASRPEQLSGRDRLGLAAILGLFVLWANLHGAVVLGLLVLAVTAGCDLVQDRCNLRSRVLACLALLAPVAVCVNPYGLAYWRALRAVGSYTLEQLVEWQPIWTKPFLPADMVIGVVVLPLLALGAWLLNPNRRWAQLGWLLLLALLFVRARRNVWPFLLTCLLVLAGNAQVLDPETLWRKASWFARRRVGQDAQPLPALIRWSGRLCAAGLGPGGMPVAPGRVPPVAAPPADPPGTGGGSLHPGTQTGGESVQRLHQLQLPAVASGGPAGPIH